MIAVQQLAAGFVMLAFSAGACGAGELLAQAQPRAPAAPDAATSERLRHARQLARAGRHDEAVQAYRALFPNAFPDDGIALEHAQSLAATRAGRDAGARLIAELARKHPDDARFRVAWASDLSTRRPVAESTLRMLRDLAALPDVLVARQAREAWRRAVLAMQRDPASLPALRDYVAANPGETAVQERIEEIQQAPAPARQSRPAPPARAPAHREAEAVGNLGLLRLREERHAEAVELFERARRMAPADAARWDGLLKTARYWNLMRRAREAHAAGAHDDTEARLREAMALDPAEPSSRELMRQSRAARLRMQAKARQDEGRGAEAIAMLEEAAALEPADPWLALELARSYAARGERDRAAELFATRIAQRPTHADTRFAYAIFLESVDRQPDAMTVLEGIAPGDRSEAMTRMQRRLWVAIQANRAAAFVRAGKLTEAEGVVASVQAAAPEQAEAVVELKLSLALGKSEALRGAGQHGQALRSLDAVASGPLTPAQQNRARLERARALRGMGRTAEATEIYAGIAQSDPREREAQLALLDARSRSADHAGDVDQAVAYERQVLALEPTETWRYRRLAELLDRQLAWSGAGIDALHRSGSGGKSRLSAQELVLGHRQGWSHSGRAFFRVAPTRIASGGLDQADSFEVATFGTLLLCQPACGGGTPRSQEHGVALSAGSEHPSVRADIGTTPLGFPVVNLVGGAVFNGALGPASCSIDVSRRAVASSLLSYAGTRDPNTGRTWGGVVASGVRASASLDRGGDYGAWALAGVYRLTGRNVQDNDKAELMAGAYRRLINEDNRQLAVGVGGMLWRFSENAGEFTLGHGGYYSPRSYESISLPVTFAARTAFTSIYARASVSLAWSDSRRAPYYPTDSALQAQAEALAAAGGTEPFYAGGSHGRSVGRAFSAAVEHQAAAGIVVGARLDLERSTNYTPNRLLLYVRVTPGTPAQPPAMPPEPVVLPGHQY